VSSSRWTPPTPGDIVWCRFPKLPRRSPGPKPRPALVCDVTDYEDGITVTVVYGTSQGLNRLHRGEFAITKQASPTAYATAGLSHDTKFDFRQAIELPWNEDFFAAPPHAPNGQHPKLGSLHASMVRAAHAAMQASRPTD